MTSRVPTSSTRPCRTSAAPCCADPWPTFEAAAEDAERKAKWEARKELARSPREHDKTAVDAKLDELKAKLSRRQKAPA